MIRPIYTNWRYVTNYFSSLFQIAEEVSKIKEEQMEKLSAAPVQIQQSLLGMSEPTALKGLNITLNSTSEFCRTLGEIPTYGEVIYLYI